MRTYVFSFVVSASLLACTGCARKATSTPPSSSLLLRTTENPDKSLDYHFKNGESCHKSADYTKYVNTKGALEIKGIFNTSGSFESKWEKVKQVSPRFQELEAVFFDICYEYGEGRLTKEQYEERRRIYEQIRQRLLGQQEGPTFQEKLENVTFSLGGGGIHTIYRLSDLEKAPREPFNLGGFSPVRIYAETGKVYADVTVYGGPASPPIEVKHNEVVVGPPNWDRNFSQSALEVVNEKQFPVFQLIYKTPSHIVFNGIFPFPGGLILANEEGSVVNPTVPVTFSLKRIFKYPSWKYPGQYE